MKPPLIEMKPILVITLFACAHPAAPPPPQRSPVDPAVAVSKCAEDCTFSPACHEPSRGPRETDRGGAGWDDSALVERCRTLIGRLGPEGARSCGAAWHMGRMDCVAQTEQGPHYASDFDRCIEPCLAAIP